MAINTIKGPHEKLFTESDVCKDNKDKMLKFQAVLEKARIAVLPIKCGCDGIIDDLTNLDGACNKIIEQLNKIKTGVKNISPITLYQSDLSGQITINKQCMFVTLKNPGGSFDVSSSTDVENGFSFKGGLSVTIANSNADKINALKSYVLGGGESLTGTISPEMLKKIFPLVDFEDSEKILPFLNKYLKEFNISSCIERIHFFTQIAEETNELQDLVEAPSKFASSKSNYKGRGLMQLTGWKYNYEPFEAYCKKLGNDVDFENHPEEVASNPKYSVLSAFWYWKIGKNCTKYCKSLNESDLLKISKLVNCGNIFYCGTKANTITGKSENCYDCEPNGWNKRKSEFERLKSLYPCK